MLRHASSLMVSLLLGIVAVHANWKLRQGSHIKATPPLEGINVDYFANQLQNENDFMKHLNTILIPRVPDTPGSTIVREHISNTLKELGWDVEILQHTQQTPVGQKTFRNVVATFDSNAPRRLVLACHYDTLVKPQNFLGLTDSAVPCAQMLNLAVTLKRDLQDDKNGQHELTLQLIFFDGEEAFNRWSSTDSTYGSRRLAQDWDRKIFSHEGVDARTLERIDLFVLLDLIGTSDVQFVSLKRNTQKWYNRFVRIEKQLKNGKALVQYNRPIFKDQSSFFASVEDDHVPFEKRGELI
eukprot:TCALIF_11218-PA protein Name:"Similar to QPCT Glutaminyl-peptide cyclotransferase (Gloydius blomhoffii)" AED:0.17 eAED:0.17 QI:1000/1/0.8/1/1/1/5/0/296